MNVNKVDPIYQTGEMIEIQKGHNENQEKLKNIWKRAESEIALSFGSKCGFAAFFMGMVITLVLVAGVTRQFGGGAALGFAGGSVLLSGVTGVASGFFAAQHRKSMHQQESDNAIKVYNDSEKIILPNSNAFYNKSAIPTGESVSVNGVCESSIWSLFYLA